MEECTGLHSVGLALHVNACHPHVTRLVTRTHNVQFSPLTNLGCRGGGGGGRFRRYSLPDLSVAIVNSSGIGRDVHSLMLSIMHFLCRPRRRPLSKVPRRVAVERLSWRVTCPNQAYEYTEDAKTEVPPIRGFLFYAWNRSNSISVNFSLF